MLSKDDIAHYREHGYVVARGVMSADDVATLRRGCDELAAQAREMQNDTFVGTTFFALHRPVNPFAKNANETPPVPGLLRRVTYPYAQSAIFNQYRAHPRLLACVAALLGPDLKQIVNQVNFNPPKSTSGWGWHQDYRFRKAGIGNLVQDFVQTITAIDVCSTLTGGLRVVPGSAKLGDLKLDTNNEQAEDHFDPTKAVTPEMQPGDVVFFNSHVIHGSTANRSDNPRRVYINGYARGTSKIGMPVLVAGKPTTEITGKMEYEGDLELLPKASKY
jgi:ectoine hydroxylase-related dioxygenase (phytanoyl-CoA dioxygenase family)